MNRGKSYETGGEKISISKPTSYINSIEHSLRKKSENKPRIKNYSVLVSKYIDPYHNKQFTHKRNASQKIVINELRTNEISSKISKIKDANINLEEVLETDHRNFDSRNSGQEILVRFHILNFYFRPKLINVTQTKPNQPQTVNQKRV